MMAKEPAARPADGWAAQQLLEEIAAQPMSPPTGPGGISAEERRLVWVMLVADVEGEEEPTRVLGTMPYPSPAPASPNPIVEAHGADLEHLADSTALITFRNDGTGEESERAAMTALAWRAQCPAARIALAAGPGVHRVGPGAAAAPLEIGELVDRGTAALAAAEPGTILLDDAARTLLERRFVVVGDELGEQRATDETVLHVLGREPPFVGRKRELAALTATLDECIDERVARAVALRGEAGIGKSRLLRVLAREARRREPVAIMRGGLDALQDGAAFALLASVLRSVAGVAQGDDLPSAREKLQRRVAVNLPIADRQRVAMFLGEIASIPFADDPRLAAARSDAGLMRDSMHTAIEDFFAAEAVASPLLLILDNVHWADTPSLSLVRSVLHHLKEHPLMVVLSGRPELEERLGRAGKSIDADVIALGPLSRKGSQQLVRSILGDRFTEAEALSRKSGGNPLFIEELARAAAQESGSLADSVLGAVQARLDKVDGVARLVLRAASVFGLRFWTGGVAALVEGGTGPISVPRCMAELERREIVVRSRRSLLGHEPEYSFVHDLIRDGAYAMLTDSDRQRGHALAGQWLEQAGAPDAEMLATHFQRGGASTRARPWLLKAEQQALDGNDFERALVRADDALAAGCDVVVPAIVKAQAWHALGREADARASAQLALSKAESGTRHWFRAVIEIVQASTHADAADEVERLCVEVRHAPVSAEAMGDKVSALAILAWIVQQSGRAALAYELAGLATKLADAHEVRDPLSRAHLSGVRAVRAYGRGDLAGYLRESEHAADLFDNAGLQRHSCGQALNVTVGYISVGCYERANEVVTKLLNVVRRLGLRSKECFALCLVSNARLELGDLDGAEDAASQGWTLANELQIARHLGYSETLLGRIASERGDHEGAAEKLQSALRRFESSPAYRVHTLAALAQARLRQGDEGKALELATHAHELASDLGVGGASSGHIALTRGEALLALGRRPEAAAVVDGGVRSVLERAKAFQDDWLQERFLQGIAAHRRLLEIGRELSE
ncbi:MAG: AAA family ATPase [Deltaproteobacteria bacterium]|nr:AAA family ATPase [Deltaproteobacteria bacterium]